MCFKYLAVFTGLQFYILIRKSIKWIENKIVRKVKNHCLSSRMKKKNKTVLV